MVIAPPSRDRIKRLFDFLAAAGGRGGTRFSHNRLSTDVADVVLLIDGGRVKCIDIKHTLFHVVLLYIYTDTQTQC